MRGRKGLLFGALALAPLLAAAPAPMVSVSDLDALVGRWMDLRSAIADEKRSWQARQEQWQEEIRLLEAEKKKLRDDLEEFNRVASSAEQDRAGVLARKEAMAGALKDLHPVFDRAETRLRTWEPLVPVPLREGLAKGLTALPATQPQADKQPLTERGQRTATLYTVIESLHHECHATQEILDTGAGQRRQVDVLYLGLARGFAVSTDDQWAAVGTPCEGGWVWQSRPEIARQVREALQVLNRQKTARLVTLPMQILDPTSTPAASREVKP
ncbi:MAG TPA: DUF3450 family protein [Sedimentisphaerales bacterium]|nr:DUF3450 family protein [Sedimentisphaerales bacterium]